MRFAHRILSGLVFIAILLPGRIVVAQEVLQEIVVTAQKRTQSLQDVPVAVDAFTGAALTEAGAVQPVDLANVTPNLTTKNAVGNTSPIFALRGIGLNDFATNGTQPVGVYLDEVYLVNNAELSFQMMDLQRVEVLKGPQGTLYGRNTTAGAVNFITNKPTTTFDAGASVTGGEWDLFGTEAYINGPLGDHLSGRLSVSGERQFKGFFVNDATGQNWGQSRRANWRGQLLWDFDTTHVLLNYHGGIDKSDDWYYKWIAEAVPGQTPTSVADAALAAQQSADIYHGNHAFQPQPYIDNTSHGLTLSADHDYGGSTVKSISSVEDLDFVRTEDYGSIPVPNGWNRYSGHLAQYSEELRLSSNGVQRWSWIVGAFFGRDRLHEFDHFDETDNPIYNTYIFEEKYLQTTTSAALFSHNEISLTDAMRLTAGLRYTEEQKHFTGGTSTLPGDHDSNNIGLVNGTVCNPTCLVDTVLKYHEPTGKLGLDYRIGDALLYASFSRGYKSGGITGVYVTDIGAKAPYNPEFINAYEVGFKSTWADNKLRLNGALFFYDYKDLQAFGLVGNEFRIFNIAKSRVSGLELESSWVPFSGFQWDFGLGLLDTKVLESNVLAQAPSGVYGSIVGHRLGNAPKIELDSAMSYHWALSEKLKATMILDANYRGDTFYYVQGDPRQHIGGYGLFNPSIAVGDPADIWKLSVWAKNALDKLYFREIFNDGGSVIGFPAAPRQIGATFSYRWR